MNGKSKCKILKQIRKEIARSNDIEFVTSECKFQGDCTGTCPKCEAEVRYLKRELSKRKQAGKAVAVAGIAAALVVAGGGCAASQISETTATEAVEQTKSATQTVEQTQPTTDTMVDGEMVIGEQPYEETEPVEFMGVPMETTLEVLTGDIALPEEEWTE